MKKTLIIGTTILLLAGCSSSQTASSSQPNSSPNQTQEAKMTKVKNTPEEALQTFYKALKNKEYNKLSNYVTIDNLDMTPNDYVSKVKEYDFNNRIERTDILIGDFVTYDETHKWAKVSVQFKAKGKEQAESQVNLVVLKDNQWLFDPSSIVSKKPLNLQPRTTTDKALTFSDFYLNQLVNGIQLQMKIQNNSKTKPLKFGYADKKVIAKLQTDNQLYSGGTTTINSIEPSEVSEAYLFFENAKGIPQSFDLGNVYYDNPLAHMLSYHVDLQ